MNSKLKNELRIAIDSFAHDITALVQAAVADAIGSAAAAKVGGRRAGKAAAATAKAVPADVLLREVKRAADQRMEQIAKNLGTTTASLGAPMKQLLADKKVKASGKARGTKYRAA